MAEDQDPEREMESRQAAGLYPIGRALRATYHADNHDSLGNDLTGLMLHLARVEPPSTPAAAIAPPPRAAPAAAPPRLPWFQRLLAKARR